MTTENVKKANELVNLIKVTEDGLKSMIEFRESLNDISDDKIYKDNLYFLSISQFSDGSGHKAVLNRYMGNKELLGIIIDKLQEQLDVQKALLESL